MNIKLEDLEINNYKIYQDKDSFNFGIDAVLLANFALRNYGMVDTKKAVLNICDLCSGDLPIPLIMYAKRKEFLNNNIHIDAYEIDKAQVELSQKSLTENQKAIADAKNILSDISIYNIDINEILIDNVKYKNIYESYDMITCNPPYMKKGSAIVNADDRKTIARHEVSITLDDICKITSKILKSNKKFYMVHHSERFTEIVSALKKYNMQVKKAEFIYPSIDKISNLVLIEAVKDASEGIKILEPIIIYDEKGAYAEKVLKIYGK